MIDPQLKRGLLDICVLSALRKGDSYGYQIIKDLVAGKTPAQKIIYTPEQGFDCDTLTQADVDKYGT